MLAKRYKELSAGPKEKLTSQEYSEGWRFCECEWDGMLININDREGEGQFCHCYSTPKKETHTIIEFGCWYCRLSSWLRHKFNRCGSWCSYCIAESEKHYDRTSGEI